LPTHIHFPFPYLPIYIRRLTTTQFSFDIYILIKHNLTMKLSLLLPFSFFVASAVASSCHFGHQDECHCDVTPYFDKYGVCFYGQPTEFPAFNDTVAQYSLPFNESFLEIIGDFGAHQPPIKSGSFIAFSLINDLQLHNNGSQLADASLFEPEAFEYPAIMKFHATGYKNILPILATMRPFKELYLDGCEDSIKANSFNGLSLTTMEIVSTKINGMEKGAFVPLDGIFCVT
jgi:hypothetical protein